jgi:hypothetical protein
MGPSAALAGSADGNGVTVIKGIVTSSVRDT